MRILNLLMVVFPMLMGTSYGFIKYHNFGEFFSKLQQDVDGGDERLGQLASGEDMAYRKVGKAKILKNHNLRIQENQNLECRVDLNFRVLQGNVDLENREVPNFELVVEGIIVSLAADNKTVSQLSTGTLFYSLAAPKAGNPNAGKLDAYRDFFAEVTPEKRIERWYRTGNLFPRIYTSGFGRYGFPRIAKTTTSSQGYYNTISNTPEVHDFAGEVSIGNHTVRPGVTTPVSGGYEPNKTSLTANLEFKNEDGVKTYGSTLKSGYLTQSIQTIQDELGSEIKIEKDFVKCEFNGPVELVTLKE